MHGAELAAFGRARRPVGQGVAAAVGAEQVTGGRRSGLGFMGDEGRRVRIGGGHGIQMVQVEGMGGIGAELGAVQAGGGHQP